mmetsp:Transcript_44637/g.105875  ORF Transcript_44637/g.105875 Transcript_44637/m.105875 type:complete len:212 (+) Transcript_44637:92-727(+)
MSDGFLSSILKGNSFFPFCTSGTHKQSDVQCQLVGPVSKKVAVSADDAHEVKASLPVSKGWDDVDDDEWHVPSERDCIPAVITSVQSLPAVHECPSRKISVSMISVPDFFPPSRQESNDSAVSTRTDCTVQTWSSEFSLASTSCETPTVLSPLKRSGTGKILKGLGESPRRQKTLVAVTPAVPTYFAEATEARGRRRPKPADLRMSLILGA